MSLLFSDSFDGILAGASRWNTWHANNVIHTDYGRWGSKGLNVAINNAEHLAMLFPSAPAAVVVGAWVYYGQAGAQDSSSGTFNLISSAANQCRIYRNADNRLVLNGTAVGSVGDVPPFTWLFIEMRAQFGTGVELRVNGVTIHSGALAGSGTVASFRNGGVTGVMRLEDIYMTDGTFYGPVRITNSQPSGNGNRSELVGSDGNSVDNFALVNDGGEATYVEGDPADGDTYAFDDTVSAEDVLGVLLSYRALDSLGAGTEAVPQVRSGGVDFDGTSQVLAGSAGTFFQGWENDPDTAAAWTTAGVDAAEFGVEFA